MTHRILFFLTMDSLYFFLLPSLHCITTSGIILKYAVIYFASFRFTFFIRQAVILFYVLSYRRLSIIFYLMQFTGNKMPGRKNYCYYAVLSLTWECCFI